MMAGDTGAKGAGMARKAAAEHEEGVLEVYEGRKVMGAGVRITKAGDGLSDAMDLAPEMLPYGSTVYFVVRGEVTQVNHRRMPKTDHLMRVHTVEAIEVARVDGPAIEELLDAEAERIADLKRVDAERRAVEEEERLAAEEAEAGIQHLPG
jgi:hypothetical protein